MQDHQSVLSVEEEQGMLGMLAELIGQLRSGSKTRKQLDLFLQDENPFTGEEKKADLDFVSAVLGRDKIIGVNQASKVWGIENLTMSFRYLKSTIRRCSKENQRGESDWRLVCIFGLSLKQQRNRLSVDNAKQAYFDKHHNFIEDKDILCFKPQGGWYLINFKGVARQEFSHQPEDQQCGCSVAVLVESMLTFIITSGLKTKLDWLCCDSTKGRIRICFEPREGIRVDYFWCNDDYNHLRVAQTRTFDF